VISHTSSRTSKCVYPRGCLYAYHTVRYSSRSVSATEDSRKASPEPSSIFEKEKSDKKEISFGPRMSIISRVTIDKLFHRVAFLQLFVAPSSSTPEERTHFMSWNDQVVFEKSRDIASRVISAPQAPISTSLMTHGTNHRTTELSSQLGGGSIGSDTCGVTDNYIILVIYNNDSLPQVSQPVTSDIVTPEITYNSDFWNGDYYVTSLSGHPSYLETDARVLVWSVLHIACFIQKHANGSYPIE